MVTPRVANLWKGLTGMLSGVYCGSLEQMKETVTSNSLLSFNDDKNRTAGRDPLLLKYSALPREAVCTENLTPWSKMLPCRSKVKKNFDL